MSPGGLADETARIWWRRFPIMGFWFCIGFAAHAAGTVGSAVLGARYGVLATIVFMVGVMGPHRHPLRPPVRRP